jgi:hypothetical protein
MGPAEIVASLNELCDEEGPRFPTERIVSWIEGQRGFESHAELIAFAKRMKARQYARRLIYEDEETGQRVKRLWSFRDPSTGERYYHDIAQLSPKRRRKLIDQYVQFSEQLRSVRRAMADYFAGQEFFSFYTEPVERDLARPRPRSRRAASKRSVARSAHR